MVLAKLEAVIASFQRVSLVWFDLKQAVCPHVVLTNLPPGVLDSTGCLGLCRFGTPGVHNGITPAVHNVLHELELH